MIRKSKDRIYGKLTEKCIHSGEPRCTIVGAKMGIKAKFPITLIFSVEWKYS